MYTGKSKNLCSLIGIMTTFVFNMGYDTSHVSSVLARESLEDGCRVILITPGKSDERQENAIDDISNQLSSLDFDIELETFTAGKSVEEDIAPILELLRVEDEIIVSLSGGARDILVPLTAALMVYEGEVEKIYFRSDLNSELSEISLPEFSVRLSSTEREIMRAVDSGEDTVDRIAEKTECSNSTVYRRIDDLLDENLIEKEGGSPARFELTDFGGIKLD